MKLRNEILLQITVFGMTALSTSLLIAKVYPTQFLNIRKSVATIIVSPVPEPTIFQKTAYIPEFISIPSVNISLNVGPGKIINNEWTLYDDKASWLSTSQTLGEGNVIIYAHNKEKIFANLKNIHIGDEILVDGNNKKFVYVVSEKGKVLPTDIEAIISDRNQLTLYTCEGTFDQKRLIVKALLKIKRGVYEDSP